MGIMSGVKRMGRALPGLSQASAAKYIDSGGKNAAKYMARANKNYDRAAQSADPRVAAFLAGKPRDQMIRNAAIAQRQMNVGMRYGAGALGVAGSTAMLPNRDQRRGGYNPGPMMNIETAKGTGRYA